MVIRFEKISDENLKIIAHKTAEYFPEGLGKGKNYLKCENCAEFGKEVCCGYHDKWRGVVECMAEKCGLSGLHRETMLQRIKNLYIRFLILLRLKKLRAVSGYDGQE